MCFPLTPEALPPERDDEYAEVKTAAWAGAPKTISGPLTKDSARYDRFAPARGAGTPPFRAAAKGRRPNGPGAAPIAVNRRVGVYGYWGHVRRYGSAGSM
jgi:hypothetical protein